MRQEKPPALLSFFLTCPRCSQPTIFSKTWEGKPGHGLRRPTSSARLIHLTGSHAFILCRSWPLIDCVPRYASLCRSDAGFVPSQSILLLRVIPAFRRANALGWVPNVTHRPRFLLHHQYPTRPLTPSVPCVVDLFLRFHQSTRCFVLPD